MDEDKTTVIIFLVIIGFLILGIVASDDIGYERGYKKGYENGYDIGHEEGYSNALSDYGIGK